MRLIMTLIWLLILSPLLLAEVYFYDLTIANIDNYQYDYKDHSVKKYGETNFISRNIIGYRDYIYIYI